MSELREKWDRRYLQGGDTSPQPANVLAENSYLLPRQGDALDLACGRGGNALLLARRGLCVQAWDISSVALDKLQHYARAEGMTVQVEARDVTSKPPLAASFDVIVVSRFLERSLAPLFCAALRPGGLLFYQTFVRDKVSQDGPGNPDFLLAENELLNLFSQLTLRVYREEGSVGEVAAGMRNEAMLVAQRPPA